MASQVVLGNSEAKAGTRSTDSGYEMIDDQTKSSAKLVFVDKYVEEGKPLAWADLEFEKWWKNETKEICINKRNKSNTTKCHTPCSHCLLLRARDQ